MTQAYNLITAIKTVLFPKLMV